MGGKKRKETFEFSKENGYMWTGVVERERREYCSPVNVQSNK